MTKRKIETTLKKHFPLINKILISTRKKKDGAYSTKIEVSTNKKTVFVHKIAPSYYQSLSNSYRAMTKQLSRLKRDRQEISSLKFDDSHFAQS